MLGDDSLGRAACLVLFAREAGAAHILWVLRLADALNPVQVFHFAVKVLDAF